MDSTAQVPVPRRHIAVGLDGSDTGRAAVEYAAELAARRRVPLHVVHAFEPSQYDVRPMGDLRPETTSVMRNAADRLIEQTVEVLNFAYPDLEVVARVEPGSAELKLIEESETAAVVVVGARGTGGFAALLVGSTTLHIATHAHCPVVAVPVPDEHAGPRRGIVVGVDGSQLSEDAISFAFEMAAEFGQPLTALHAWSDPARTGVGMMMPLVYDPAQVSKEEEVVLAESMAGWTEKYPDVPVTHKVVNGHAVYSLVHEAANAHLLVVGSHGRGGFRSLLLGSVGHGVLHHTKVPVAIIRRERHGHGHGHGRN